MATLPIGGSGSYGLNLSFVLLFFIHKMWRTDRSVILPSAAPGSQNRPSAIPHCTRLEAPSDRADGAALSSANGKTTKEFPTGIIKRDDCFVVELEPDVSSSPCCLERLYHPTRRS